MGRLFERMAAGEERALVELYRRAAGTVYATALRVLHDAEEANDVTSEVFWRLWTRAGRFDPSYATPLAWILTITRRMALDRRRSLLRRGRLCDRLERESLFLAPPENEVLGRDRVAAALARLSPEDRALLDAAYFQGLSGAQIAARDDLPLGTVKSRMRAALLRLRDVFSRGVL